MTPNWQRWNFRSMTLFCELGRLGSVREVARVHGIDASRVSRIIAAFEHDYGTRLLERSAEGVRFSERGLEVQAQFESVLAIANVRLAEIRPPASTLAVAAAAFLSTRVVAPAIGKLKAGPRPTFRIIDVAPDELVAYGLQGAYEGALHVGELDWPRTWVSSKVGEITWQLYCRRGHPLTRRRALQTADLLEVPFIQPVYWTRGGLGFGNDHCPLPRGKRCGGTSTSTADAAVAVVRDSDELAFLPDILCREEHQRGALAVLQVQDWPAVKKPLFASFRADALTVSLARRFTAALARVVAG